MTGDESRVRRVAPRRGPRSAAPSPTARSLLLGAGALALAAGLLPLVLGTGPRLAHHPTWWWPLLGPAFALSHSFRVTVGSRRYTHHFDLSGLPLVVGVALLPADDLLAATVLGFGISLPLYRFAAVRVPFNLGNHVLAAEVAVIALSRLATVGHLLDPRGALGLAAAVIAPELLSALVVAVALTVTAGPPDADYWRRVGFQLLVIFPINLVLAVIAVSAYQARPWVLGLIAGPGLAAGWWYRRSEKIRDRFSDLQSIYSFGRSLSDCRERSDVVAVALAEARRVLRCQRAELSVDGPGGLIRFRLEPDGAQVEDVLGTDGFEGSVLASGDAVLAARAAPHPYLEARGLKDALAVPFLFNGGTQRALLLVADRDGDSHATFVRADLDLLAAMTAHLATALTAAEHLEDLRRSIAQREHQAFHDGLTGMPNRAMFMQALTTALEHAGGGGAPAVVLLDLDGFRQVNDALGHATGDRVLEMVGARVSQAIGEVGMAARLGGDEFAVLVPMAAGVEEVMAEAERLLDAAARPMEIGTVSLAVRAAAGIAAAPVHGRSAAALIRSADVALYAAKRSGRRLSVYEARMDNRSARRLGLAGDLARAIERDELELWFQPVADMARGQVAGFEALLRWPHPQHGFVAPDEFIPISEQTGLIDPLTWWVARRALAELRRRREEGYEFTMAVNVSVRSLVDPAMVERIRSLLNESGLVPTCLTLEVTESSMMDEYEKCERSLRLLSDMGVRIAIDDFGTGYSSLSRLKILPVNVVKIDRAFIRNICTDRADQAIVRSVIELARVMGHQVVAEGIEDLSTWDRLAALGCDLGQGHYFARPMPAPDCRSWVTGRQAPSLAPVRRLGARRTGA